MKKKTILMTALVVVLVAGCFLLAQESYAGLLLAFIAIYGIATTGLDVLFGYSGQISFGHAAFFALGSYTSAIMSVKLGLPPLLTVVVGSVLATLFGVVLAFPASKLVKHFLSLLTIAFGQMVYMFVNSTTALTGGAGGIASIPKMNLFGLELADNASMFLFSAVILIVVLLGKHQLVHSRTGRALIAIKENVRAAQGLGINVRNHKVLAFGVSAFLTGLAGGLYAHLVGFISPETFNATQSTLFMTMLLFGGISTPAGPVVGAGVLIVIREVFKAFSKYQILIYGIFILIVLFFFPNGVVGIFSSVKNKILGARRAKNASAR